MLMRVLAVSEGDVVEVGGGLYSTPILHWACKNMGRKLITYENDPLFYKLAHGFQSQKHLVRFIKDWNEMDFKSHRGVVFIDHHPNERRAIDVLNFKNSADYIVMHDTEDEAKHQWSLVWPHFKHVYHWKDCKPWTSVVSNFKDLSKLRERKTYPFLSLPATRCFLLGLSRTF